MKGSELRKDLKTEYQGVFQSLFKEYYIPLCVYAIRFIHEKNTAEEIVQDTFAKLWEQKENLESIDSLQAYLFRMVRNNCLNYLKHLQVVNKYNQYYNQLLEQAGDYFAITRETGQSILIAKEIEKHIFNAIEKLPQQCREIFKLSRLDGLKNQEIADKKGVTINTVQKQISIALEKLREMLKPLLPVILLYVNILD